MKFLKKFDDYLLHHYPSIWITRVHYFLPLGLGIAAFLFFANLAIGWKPSDDLPDATIPIVLMIIPVLIYLVYWFVFQSRYNVAKSGGKMTIGFEYLNYFLYLLVFFVAFLIISAIPLSNYHKVKMNLDPVELEKDIANLNLGNTLVNGQSTVIFTDFGMVEFEPINYVYNYYSYDYPMEYDYSMPYPGTTIKSVSRNEALKIIKDYITSYNKYAKYPISQSAQEILKDREMNTYSYNYGNYDEGSWEIQYKLSEFDERIHNDEWYEVYQDEIFWKMMLGLIAFLAMIVWLFKQMKLRHFVIGFISICLTPLLAAIVGVIIIEVLGIRHNEEEVISFTCLLYYAILTFFAIRGYLSNTLNNTGYVMTMYLQFFLPMLPMFLWLYFGYDRHHYYFDGPEDNIFNTIYWIGWIVGLVSILAFKPVYTKFGSLPAKN